MRGCYRRNGRLLDTRRCNLPSYGMYSLEVMIGRMISRSLSRFRSLPEAVIFAHEAEDGGDKLKVTDATEPDR